MFVVQQSNSYSADAGVLLQHQPAGGLQVAGQATWLPTDTGSRPLGGGSGGSVVCTGPRPGQVGLYAQPQQGRVASIPVSTVQMAQQQPRVMLRPSQVLMPRQAVLTPAAGTASDNKQVVYVNVNGTLQRGILHNGAVYLLANDSAPAAAQGAQMGNTAMQVSNMQRVAGTQLVSVQPQAQSHHHQQLVMQQVLPTGQLVSVSGPLVASCAGVQLASGQQLQLQPQAQQQVAAHALPVTNNMVPPQMQRPQQQQPLVLVAPSGSQPPAAGCAAVPVVNGSNNPLAGSAYMQARPQQQHLVLQAPGQATRAGPVASAGMRPAVLGQGQGQGQFGVAAAAHMRPTGAGAAQLGAGMQGTSVSANTASLLPRMTASGAAAVQHTARPTALSSQPMTIAAALAALPSHPTAAGAAQARAGSNTSELSSPVAPPGTPGMADPALVAPRAKAEAPANTPQPAAAGAAGGVPASLGTLMPDGAAGGVSVTPPGTSPMTSQPGTPSRTNSMVANSTSSSSSSSTSGAGLQLGAADVAGAPTTEAEGKMAVMRMFARTFVETGIGLEQALSMIQASDRDMFAAAFATEAAATCSSAAAPAGPIADIAPAAAEAQAAQGGWQASNTGGLAELGGEQISMPQSERPASGASGLLQLANRCGGASQPGLQDTGAVPDTFSLGSWGFSLFSNVTSDVGSDQGGSSFGGAGGSGSKGLVASADAAAATAIEDVTTATLFANLNL